MSEAPLELFAVVRTGGGETVAGPDLRAVGFDDPDVVGRWASGRDVSPRQVVTAYHARLAPPRSWPAELPFVAGVKAFVTEMDDRPGGAGARWLVEDDTDVVSEVLDGLLGDGWAHEPARELGFPFPGRRIVVRRGGEARLLLEGRLDDGRRVVQLLALV